MLASFSVAKMLVVALECLLEGMGLIAYVAKVRILAVSSGGLAFALSLIAGFGLYSVSVMVAANILIGASVHSRLVVKNSVGFLAL